MYLGFKRFLDLVLVLLTAPITITLMSIITLISWMVYRQQILFIQRRIGYRGRPFKLFKFKSILHKYKNGKEIAHINSWGRFLRKWSLDELPQIYNIIKGEMSWIGPRPLLPVILHLSSEDMRCYRVLPD